VILNRINIEKEYKQAGFESFADYMNERQPCGIKRAHAYALIQAMKIRPLLPEIPGPPENAVWTETSIRPLLHKDFTPADQKIPSQSSQCWSFPQGASYHRGTLVLSRRARFNRGTLVVEKAPSWQFHKCCHRDSVSFANPEPSFASC
jgi:hypothetical protein